MKKITVALSTIAFILAIGTLFAFKPAETVSSDTMIEWFDANTLEWIETATLSEAQLDCGGGEDPCRVGYTEKTSDPEPQPAGVFVDDVETDLP